jgi:hypothetical protein
MPAHDEFRELGALAAIGQVTTSEHENLSAHLEKCPECREAYLDYSRILRQDLPQADPPRFRHKQNSVHPATDAELRERFLARVRTQGLNFSPEVEGRVAVQRKSPRFVGMRLAIACSAVALGIVSALALTLHERGRIPAAPVVSTGAVSASEPLLKQLEKTKRDLIALNDQLSAQSLDDRSLRRVLTEKDARFEQAKQSLDQLHAELAKLRVENSTLAAGHANDQSVAADLRTQVQSLQGSNASSSAALVELQDQIQLLKGSLEQRSQKLAMERQMASVSSDVRQLMGARNLHIIDVHDVNGAGKSARSFGRVFYSEGQSLVFYAFDLPNGKLTPAKYYFKAWGQQEEQAQSVRNLGTFSVDDGEQHRWVLKVNDAALLKGIDSLFVTAETVGDATAPRGKRLLYAYLAGNPNHP